MRSNSQMEAARSPLGIHQNEYVGFLFNARPTAKFKKGLMTSSLSCNVSVKQSFKQLANKKTFVSLN